MSLTVRVGTKVRLLTQVGTFPPGLLQRLYPKNGYLYEIEFENGRRLIVDGNDGATIE